MTESTQFERYRHNHLRSHIAHAHNAIEVSAASAERMPRHSGKIPAPKPPLLSGSELGGLPGGVEFPSRNCCPSRGF